MCDLFSNLLIYYLDCQQLPPNVEAITSSFSQVSSPLRWNASRHPQDSLPVFLTTQVGCRHAAGRVGPADTDFYDGFEKTVEEFASRYPLDLVLMSVHSLLDWPGENWVFDFVFPGKPLVAIYHEYFQALKRGIRTGLFNAVAPLDLIRQPGAGHQRAGRGGGAVDGRAGGHVPGDQHLRPAPFPALDLPRAGAPAAGRRLRGARHHGLGRA